MVQQFCRKQQTCCQNVDCFIWEAFWIWSSAKRSNQHKYINGKTVTLIEVLAPLNTKLWMFLCLRLCSGFFWIYSNGCIFVVLSDAAFGADLPSATLLRFSPWQQSRYRKRGKKGMKINQVNINYKRLNQLRRQRWIWRIHRWRSAQVRVFKTRYRKRAN